ncbi:hypothetical protein [Actinoplanes couchii]|uniref:Uncharacterized protein n=1 Tax=Actinoplanes couchii TaxID=403638 RepID=A0ABQ3XK56_9ACTN|nr:hypothetical protein [Actinoplanes couchii]MDR6320476.1 hypothetical protein [Actinoplanes couchii]GID58880.1 hypothetical protein Aco03nite_072840 [Actinoplanes couchii]
MAAHDIDLARQAGKGIHFAVVPEHLPPGLVSMEPADDAVYGGVTDIYSFGTLKAMVKYTATPGDGPCGKQSCVRAAEVGVETAEAPSLHYAGIWLTGQPSSPQQETEVRDFWAGTTWLPTAEADWFTELAHEGDVDVHHP